MKLTYATIRDYFSSLGGELLTSEEDVSQQMQQKSCVMSYVYVDIDMHNCNHKVTTTYKYCKRTNSIHCNECASEAKSLSYNDVHNLVSDMNGQLLTSEEEFKTLAKTTKRSQIHVMIKLLGCGHSVRSTYSMIQQSKQIPCMDCYKLKKSEEMSLTYDDVNTSVTCKDCKLITTTEEFDNRTCKASETPLEIMMCCNHIRIINIAEFKRLKEYRCIECNSEANKEQMVQKNGMNEYGVTNCHFVEKQAYDFIEKEMSTKFIVKKMCEGNLCDFVYKPIHILDDEWIMVQLKSASKIDEYNSCYFRLQSDYTDMIMIFTCKDSIWVIPYEDCKTKNVHITNTQRSIYSKYKCIDNSDFLERMNDLYCSRDKVSFDDCISYISDKHETARQHKQRRIESIEFLEFKDYPYENQATDFTINTAKIQEKSTNNNIIKQNGTVSWKFTFNRKNSNGVVYYKKGDNDFYWFNCGDQSTFFVIPEKLLIDTGHISVDNSKGKTTIKLYDNINDYNINTRCLIDYKFKYSCIDKDRLIQMFENF